MTYEKLSQIREGSLSGEVALDCFRPHLEGSELVCSVMQAYSYTFDPSRLPSLGWPPSKRLQKLQEGSPPTERELSEWAHDVYERQDEGRRIQIRTLTGIAGQLWFAWWLESRSADARECDAAGPFFSPQALSHYVAYATSGWEAWTFGQETETKEATELRALFEVQVTCPHVIYPY